MLTEERQQFWLVSKRTAVTPSCDTDWNMLIIETDFHPGSSHNSQGRDKVNQLNVKFCLILAQSWKRHKKVKVGWPKLSCRTNGHFVFYPILEEEMTLYVLSGTHDLTWGPVQYDASWDVAGGKVCDDVTDCWRQEPSLCAGSSYVITIADTISNVNVFTPTRDELPNSAQGWHAVRLSHLSCWISLDLSIT